MAHLPRLEDGRHEVGERALVVGVGFDPRRANLGFARRFERVANQSLLGRLAPRAVGQVVDPAASTRRRPERDENLIEQIFGVRVGRHSAVHRAPVLGVQPSPATNGALPVVRQLGERAESRANVGAALGVVRVRREQPGRPSFGAKLVGVVQAPDGVGQRLVRPAADLVARGERHIDIERGVFDALRRRRRAELLKALCELDALEGSRRRRPTPSRTSTMKLTMCARRAVGDGARRRAADDAAVRLIRRRARVDICSIDRQRDDERDERRRQILRRPTLPIGARDL